MPTWSRWRARPGDYLRDFLGQIPRHSPAHVQINRNKRSVTIDLRSAAGREVFWRLLATADVFVDGNAADACEKLGIGYEEQRATSRTSSTASTRGSAPKVPMPPCRPTAR